MILDSPFLIDLERELRREKDGPAVALLQAHGSRSLAITFTIAGELAAGDSLGADQRKWEDFLKPFEMLRFSNEVAWIFGNIYRHLKKEGKLIGANDLWIAASALRYDRPLVTRIASDFQRIPGLQVLGY